MSTPDPIYVTFVCPYPRCVWPTCLKTPNGWQTWSLCRSAEAEAVDQVLDAISDRIDARPASALPKEGQ